MQIDLFSNTILEKFLIHLQKIKKKLLLPKITI